MSAPTAGYAPAVNILAVITKFRESSVSGPVNRDLLVRIGIKESLAKRVLNSLTVLGLVDEDGKVTDEFRTLIDARPDEYQSALAAFLRLAYKDIFTVVDPAKATPSDLRNAFWSYEPRGQIDPMIRLFVGLCEAAGLVSPTPERVTRTAQRRTTVGPDNRRTAGPERKSDESSPAEEPPRSTPMRNGAITTNAREKYVELLLAKVAEQTEPDSELLDRIERALGIAASTGGSP